jgi:transcriptional regulator with XRE-family HTH domain
VLDVGFPEQLAELRRERGLTQAALAERIGVRANQISRYESGQSEPTLGVLRQLAIALSVSADALVFGGEDRLAKDQALQLAFEATVLLDPEEQEAVRMLLEGFLSTHQQRRGGEGPRARRRQSD